LLVESSAAPFFSFLRFPTFCYPSHPCCIFLLLRAVSGGCLRCLFGCLNRTALCSGGSSRGQQSKQTRTGNRYQARSNFDITSFRYQLISSSFSSSRSNRDVTSFPRKQISQNFIVGTYGRTDRPTDRPTSIVSCRGAALRLKRSGKVRKKNRKHKLFSIKKNFSFEPNLKKEL
jgi:hypothetical protein